jgi:hypothetical protein
MKKIFQILSVAFSVFMIAAAASYLGADTTEAFGLSVGLNAFSYFVMPQQTGVLGMYIGAANMNGETGIQVVSSERERAVYEHNVNKERFRGKNMTPGFLRLEQVIDNAKNSLTFVTYSGDSANVYPTEQRLDRNDAFIATEVGLFILRQDVANKKTNGDLHSYVNLTTFAAAAGFTPADLKAIYQGRLSIEIARERKLVALDTSRFLNVPETQQTGATNYDQKDGKKDGFIRLTPQIVIDGAGTNEFKVEWPSYAGWAGASVTAGTEHRVVLYFRGLLVTGGSVNS